MAISSQDIFDAAFLSIEAYDHAPSANVGNGWTLLSYVNLGIALENWNNETQDEDNSPYVYDFGNAQAIVARSGSTLAISFRGTDDEDVDFFQDIHGALVDFTSYYDKFSPLVAALNAFIPAEGVTKVLVTGHSLGATAAELYMADHLVSLDGESYVAITFGSPGEHTLSGNDSRILNFGHTGDPVFEAVNEAHGIDVEINLPDQANRNLLELLAQVGEHSKELYALSIGLLTDSNELFSAFAATP